MSRSKKAATQKVELVADSPIVDVVNEILNHQLKRVSAAPRPKVPVVIKSAQLDSRVAPVVSWLNEFSGIYTRWSCQVGDSGLPRDPPYVLFYCDEPCDLVRVLRRLRGFAEVEVEFYPEAASVRYVARFMTTQAFDNFLGVLDSPARNV